MPYFSHFLTNSALNFSSDQAKWYLNDGMRYVYVQKSTFNYKLTASGYRMGSLIGTGLLVAALTPISACGTRLVSRGGLNFKLSTYGSVRTQPQVLNLESVTPGFEPGTPG